MEEEDAGRPSIWSIHPDSHPRFVVVCAGTGIALGVLYLAQSWPPWYWSWAGGYDVAVDVGHMGLTAVSLAWTAFNGREAMRIASESFKRKRFLEGVTAGEAEERKALKDFIESQGEYLSPKKIIDFLNRREAEAHGIAQEDDETKGNAMLDE